MSIRHAMQPTAQISILSVYFEVFRMDSNISEAIYANVPVKLNPLRPCNVHLLSPKSVILTCQSGPFCATRIF